MLFSLGSGRRIVGRSARARLHRHPAPCGRVRAQRYALLACPAWGQCESQRRKDALADRERAVTGQPARSPIRWSAGLECPIVPCAWLGSRPLEHRA